jgi:hypothetical protein
VLGKLSVEIDDPVRTGAVGIVTDSQARKLCRRSWATTVSKVVLATAAPAKR